ncbi:MAG TPA: hypothetical protein VIL71_14805 [Spirillospora sp.]
MNRCRVTTGFFVLGHCGRPATATCARCSRAICTEHTWQGPFCPECAVAQNYAGRDAHDPAWVGLFRRSYYERTSRTYNDPNWYATFDAFDRGAFNPGRRHSGGWEADDDAGFVDS